MEKERQSQIDTADIPVSRSRKENRRTLKGCITQVERIQQQIRNVGMQYADRNAPVFVGLSGQHDILDMVKNTLRSCAENL